MTDKLGISQWRFVAVKRGWRVAFSAVAGVTGSVVLIAIAIGSNGRDMVQYFAAAMLYGISSGEDVDECARTLDTFLQRHDVPKNSKSVPGRPSIFCNPGSTGVVFKMPPKIAIYGAVDRAIQDKYLETCAPSCKRLEVKISVLSSMSRKTGSSGNPQQLVRPVATVVPNGYCVEKR